MKLRSIILLIIIMIWVSQLMAEGNSIQNFFNKKYSKEQNFSTNLPNYASGELLNLKGEGSIGMKTDCSKINFNVDVKTFINNIIASVSNMKDVAKLYLFNKTIETIARIYAEKQCSEDLEKILRDPVVNKQIETKYHACLYKEKGEALILRDQKETGWWLDPKGCRHKGHYYPCPKPWVIFRNPFAGINVKTKPLKLATASSYCYDKAVSEVAGQSYSDCVRERKQFIIDKILDFTNWNMSYNINKAFGLQQKCILAKNYKQIDLIGLLKDVAKDGIHLPNGEVLDLKSNKFFNSNVILSLDSIKKIKKRVFAKYDFDKYILVKMYYPDENSKEYKYIDDYINNLFNKNLFNLSYEYWSFSLFMQKIKDILDYLHNSLVSLLQNYNSFLEKKYLKLDKEKVKIFFLERNKFLILNDLIKRIVLNYYQSYVYYLEKEIGKYRPIVAGVTSENLEENYDIWLKKYSVLLKEKRKTINLLINSIITNERLAKQM